MDGQYEACNGQVSAFCFGVTKEISDRDHVGQDCFLCETKYNSNDSLR